MLYTASFAGPVTAVVLYVKEDRPQIGLQDGVWTVLGRFVLRLI
jgi:hypothetical protein